MACITNTRNLLPTSHLYKPKHKILSLLFTFCKPKNIKSAKEIVK